MTLIDIIEKWGWGIFLAIVLVISGWTLIKARLAKLEHDLCLFKQDVSKEMGRRVHVNQCGGDMKLIEQKLDTISTKLTKMEGHIEAMVEKVRGG